MAFDNWLTDPKILDMVRTVYGGSIDFDPASNFVAQRYVNAKHYCVAPNDSESVFNQYHDDVMQIDGLAASWHGNVWCNPPYSAGNIDKFVDKGIAEWNKGKQVLTSGMSYDAFGRVARLPQAPAQMMFLVNSSTDCAWYHKLLNNCSVALLWRGRIKFWKIENGQALEKWEGVKSKELGLGKIGNSPRYLSTLFYMGNNETLFMQTFTNKGTFIKVPLHVSLRYS
jgi:hypothetical protein